MKIRNGFVSNSSSSSFCIYGAAIQDLDIFKKFFEGTDVDPDDLGVYDIAEIIEGYGDNDELKKKFKALKGLDVHAPDGFDTIYIGRSWDGIGDNETGKEFKKDVEKTLKDFFGEKVECDTHSESWYS